MSKRNEQGKRTLVLDMSHQEEHDCFWVLRKEVVAKRQNVLKRTVHRDVVRYRFPERYLERLSLTFPFAETSPGVAARLRRMVEIEQDIEVPELHIPDFGATLYDFQKISVARIMEHDRFMLMDEMGLGKTVQALAAITAMLATPAIVICPNSAKWVWERMIAELTPFTSAIVDGTAAQRADAIERTVEGEADILVCHVEGLRIHPELAGYQWHMNVTDEFHRFRSPRAQQTQAWHALEAERWLLMSGTPILNRVEESWSGLHRLFPDRYPNYWMFERWVTIKGKGDYPKVVGYKAKALKKLRDQLHSPEVSIRRVKGQVSDQLPEVVYQQLLVELTPEQRKLYKQIVEEMKLALENGEVTSISNMLAMVTRAKQACFSPELYGGSRKSAKLTELKDVVAELVSNGEKALIGSQWSTAARILQRELEQYGVAYVDGSVKGRKRQEQQDKFNEDDDTRLYIGTIQANQEAITLGAAGYVILTDKVWSPLANDQFVARSPAGGLRGIGHEGNVNVIEILAHDTIDFRIEALLAAKRAAFNMLIERGGGAVREQVSITDIADLF